MRRKTKTIWLRDIPIGSEYPVVIQSMTNTDTRDIKSTIRQINLLAEKGCEIARIAIVDNEAVYAIKEIIRGSSIPIIADIHFDYKLAIDSLKAGVDGIRINPNNIGSKYNLKLIIKEASRRNIPIRIGINAGSLDKEVLKKHKIITPEILVKNTLEYIEYFESQNFNKIKVSIKSSNVLMTIKAYEILSNKINYPLHIGITEAGTLRSGLIKSSIGIGILLYNGIGDTIRVSLTEDPVEEVNAAIMILKSLNIRKTGVELISCPTCGRTEINLFNLVKEVEKYIEKIKIPIKIAVMGCPVNGPGEAKDADIGIAGGLKQGLIFKKGKIIAKVKEKYLLKRFKKEIDILLKEYKGGHNETFKNI